MNIDLSQEVIESIQTIQIDGGLHEVITNVENFILDECDDDENAVKILGHIRGLRVIKRCLIKIAQNNE